MHFYRIIDIIVFMTMKKFTLIILLVLSFTPVFSQRLMTNADPKIFQFKFNKNDQSRILSTVNEDVYLNGRFNHNAVILNRISSVITDVDENGSGTADAVFMTTETSARTWNNKSSTWGEEYESVFTRDVTGKYEMEDIYFMPTVRDVPIFPDYKIKPGDTWKKQGYEAHDMRRTFGIEKPFMFPFEATYTYRGDMEGENGNVLSLIEINYNMFFTTPNLKAQTEAVLEAPKITTGYSHQKVWWDHERGQIDHYVEDFRIQIETFSGDVILFTGKAHAEVTEFHRANTEENLKKITETVKELGLENVDVKESDRGLTISIENIQFQPDSAFLMDSEKIKLTKIAEILKGFENDLLITGHCAKRGSVKMQQLLSEERAAAVAEYLSKLNVRKPNCIFTQGKGASEPIDSNLTETGRARNRRVEITIMDK